MHYKAIACTVLITITLAVYWQAGNHEFISYDDGAYVTRNSHVASGLSRENILWSFSAVGGEAGYWQPITWLSHMADVDFFGMNPRGHHLTSVFIHTASTLLLLLLLFRLTGALWQSVFVASLFALHPLHVESVAWVAERKGLLSAFFGFISLALYAEYARNRKATLYILSVLSFLLSLMSKAMLVTLPFLMLLLDYWPLDRFTIENSRLSVSQFLRRLIKLIREKIPFIACSLLSAAVTIYSQGKAGAINSLKDWPLVYRIENALVAYVRYIVKTFWPQDLAVLYPLTTSIPSWHVVGSLSVLLLVSGSVVRCGRRFPYLAVGWFWYLITLVPVNGLIQVGIAQSMADRYSYVPLIGLFIMIAWGAADITAGLRRREVILALCAGVVLSVSITLSWQQLGYWRNDITLYRHTVRVTQQNYRMLDNLARALADRGDLAAAIPVYREILEIIPNDVDTLNNLGVILAQTGDMNGAMQLYQQALRVNPDDLDVLNNLGYVLSGLGQHDAAIAAYEKALQINPDFALARNNLNVARAKNRKQVSAEK